MKRVIKNVKPKLLLHICCAPCGAYVSQKLSEKFDLVLYFCNSNIDNSQEFQKRFEEVKYIAKKFDLQLIYKKYNHEEWLSKIKGLEKFKEGNKRCLICYEDRLASLVKKSRELKIKNFSTTLSISPHKDYQKIKTIGAKLAKENKLFFVDDDFKKKDGFKKSSILAKELNLYRQNYCGCEFSRR